MAEKKTSTSKPKVKKKTTAKKATTPAKKKAAKPAVATSKKSASTPRTTAKSSTKPSTSRTQKWGKGDRAALIQQQAYFIAEKRGFNGGDPVMDWLQAEKLVDEMFN